jgi:glycosyltransferase involved in cell wall biosynthesis
MIGFNGVLLSPYTGGISTYMQNLLENFAQFIPKNELMIYLSKDQYNNYKNNFRFRSIKTPLSSVNTIQRIAFENFYWNSKLIKDGIKLYHSPISYLPFTLNIPSIVTIHDLRVFRYPETYPKSRRFYLHIAVKRSISNAMKIITVSDFTKKEILDIFGISPEKITVIHEGIDTTKFNIGKKESDITVLKKYNIKKKYIFTVGHLEPRKNFLRLIKAFELLKNDYKNSFQLVIGGMENFYYHSLYEYVSKNNLLDKVVFTGFIANNDLPVLYRNADLFVFPSTYEGFGLPPLESLAAGVPVAASDVSSIPEVLDDAAIYFNPYSVEDISGKIKQLIDNMELRNKLLSNGGKIIKNSTWKNCAKKTIEVYKAMLENIVL